MNSLCLHSAHVKFKGGRHDQKQNKQKNPKHQKTPTHLKCLKTPRCKILRNMLLNQKTTLLDKHHCLSTMLWSPML